MRDPGEGERSLKMESPALENPKVEISDWTVWNSSGSFNLRFRLLDFPMQDFPF